MLLDMNFSRDATSGKEGFYWLNKILEIDPTIAVVLITAYGDIELAVQGIKEGATNFLLKPWDNKKAAGDHFHNPGGTPLEGGAGRTCVPSRSS
jgi:FixJ family two-component response regulator